MPQKPKSVKLGSVIREFGLEVLHAGPDYENLPLHTLDVNRPGLPLAGFFEYFDTERLLIIGLTEATYTAQMTPAQRRESFERLLSYPVPALIYTRGIEPSPECMEMARKFGRTVLRTPAQTSSFISALISSLANQLAPCITRSGVMMEIYGEGVLLQGESGVGKSEVAIGLIKRGHRLIADDAVELRQSSRGTLLANAPELIAHYMELRGIGVIDISQLYGIAAIKPYQQVDMVVTLEPWKEGAVYDRMGLEVSYTHILGVKIPATTIPVKPGRDLASIIEVAAMNNRNRKMGHNAALELTHRMDELFARKNTGEE